MGKSIVSIGFVYLIAVVGWVILGSSITLRTDHQDNKLKEQVGHLWGSPLEQSAPSALLAVDRETEVEKMQYGQKSIEKTTVTDKYDTPIVGSDIDVGLKLDQRQKGLLWYSTYKVQFAGRYVFENKEDKQGKLVITFAFPAPNGRYDDFKFEVDGREIPFSRQETKFLTASIPCEPHQKHSLAVTYSSQGLDHFGYKFGDGISEVRDFRLAAVTDFAGFDFTAPNAISPTMFESKSNGAELTWRYRDLISGDSISIEMPHKINPGPLAARISFFAPVSLGFFFFLIFVISMLRRIDIHPMNYFFLAAAFFAFHLLLAYLVDHISIHLAFVICSAVSIFLVVSYMRIVVGNRFAFLDTALAQFVYLIGFSYAFFVEGFTGLAVAIGSIVTLFVVMQMTARINWAERFRITGNELPLLKRQDSTSRSSI